MVTREQLNNGDCNNRYRPAFSCPFPKFYPVIFGLQSRAAFLKSIMSFSKLIIETIGGNVNI